MGLIAGAPLKGCHLGSARSLQLAVDNEVIVTNGGDSMGKAAHRRPGRGILEDGHARS